MPRQARLDAPGTLHHVIVGGIERRKIVDDDQDRDDFVSRIGLIASETRMSISAWVLWIFDISELFTVKSGGAAETFFEKIAEL